MPVRAPVPRFVYRRIFAQASFLLIPADWEPPLTGPSWPHQKLTFFLGYGKSAPVGFDTILVFPATQVQIRNTAKTCAWKLTGRAIVMNDVRPASTSLFVASLWIFSIMVLFNFFFVYYFFGLYFCNFSTLYIFVNIYFILNIISYYILYGHMII